MSAEIIRIAKLAVGQQCESQILEKPLRKLKEARHFAKVMVAVDWVRGKLAMFNPSSKPDIPSFGKELMSKVVEKGIGMNELPVTMQKAFEKMTNLDISEPDPVPVTAE